MKLTKIVIFSCIVLLLVGAAVVPAQSTDFSWQLIDQNAYKLLSSQNGVCVAYRILEDKNKEEIVDLITEQGKSKEEASALKDDWREIRNDYLALLGDFKELGDDKMYELPSESINVSFSDNESKQTWPFYKIKSHGKNVLIPEEMGNLPFEFVYDLDSERFLIATTVGLWKIDAETGTATMISEVSFDGKSYNTLYKELNDGQCGEHKTALLWNSHVVISPDGMKAVYSSNRDCLQTGGYSLWLYDFSKNQETLLTQSKGEYLTAIAWMNNEAVLCSKSEKDTETYCVISNEGTISELPLDGNSATVLCAYENLIAYTPDNTRANEIIFAKYDLSSGDFFTVAGLELEGVLRGYGSFDFEGNNYAVLYAPANDETQRFLYVFSLADGIGKSIKKTGQNHSEREIINYFAWVNSGNLFVNVVTTTDGLLDESSWIYEL